MKKIVNLHENVLTEWKSIIRVEYNLSNKFNLNHSFIIKIKNRKKIHQKKKKIKIGSKRLKMIE